MREMEVFPAAGRQDWGEDGIHPRALPYHELQPVLLMTSILPVTSSSPWPEKHNREMGVEAGATEEEVGVFGKWVIRGSQPRRGQGEREEDRSSHGQRC